MGIIAVGPWLAKASLKKPFVPVSVSFGDSRFRGSLSGIELFQHRLRVGHLGAGGTFMSTEGGQGQLGAPPIPTGGASGAWQPPPPPPLASEGTSLRGGPLALSSGEPLQEKPGEEGRFLSIMRKQQLHQKIGNGSPLFHVVT